MNKPSIAFLGLGIMGTGMSRRLVSAGYPVTVWNRNLSKAEALKTAGAKVARSPGEAAHGAEIVIAMLADDAASRATWGSAEGALARVSNGATLIECSTLSVDWVRELSLAAQEKGCTFMDAPVTGSKAQAAGGELNFLVGSDSPIPQIIAAVLGSMGKSITHLGAVGSGAMIKLINNFVCGVQLVAIAEAIALLERTGLDRDKALNVLVSGAPGSPMVKNLVPRMTARDYTPNFLLKLMAKDMSYAIAEGKAKSLDLNTAAVALKVLQTAMPEHGEQDMSSVVELYRAQ